MISPSAPGSGGGVPPTRTPNGDVDLLSSDAPAAASPAPGGHLRATPRSDVAAFSIDDDDEAEGEDDEGDSGEEEEESEGEEEESEEDDGDDGDDTVHTSNTAGTPARIVGDDGAAA